MPSRPPFWCVGTPAAYCQPYESELDLPRLVGALQSNQPHLVWLDSARSHPLTGRYSIVGWDPWLTLSASGAAITTITSRSTGRALGSARHFLGRSPSGCRHFLAGSD
ncbi:MAG: hypothetical protein AAB289_02775, partial [Chloroflexota bacterium]